MPPKQRGGLAIILHRFMIYFMLRDYWTARIRLYAYSYFPPRAHFISDDSRFQEWVLIAPERGEFAWETATREGEALTGTAAFGDLVIARPGAPFVRRVTTPVLAYHVLQWSFVDAQGKTMDVGLPSGRLPIRDTARLTATLAALQWLYLKMDSWSVHRKAHLLEELLHLAWQTRSEPAAADPHMLAAAQLLSQRAGEAFSMEEISANFDLGPVQFTRRFRAAHGRNPIQYLTAARLEIAQRLLIETTLSLDEIAARCGWSSGAYLSQVFTSQLLITPGRFRSSRRV